MISNCKTPINQELCKLKFSWNDNLPEEICVRWRRWREGLMSLEGFSIPRCFKPEGFGKVVRAELHHFADPSQEHGYVTASFLRLINDNGKILCSFVIGKSRVRPLKNAVTVPKLELTAATIATWINKVVTKELEGRLRIDSVTYWTDSMIVLKYIANERRRFVLCCQSSRHYTTRVRTKSVASCRIGHNPGDYASRGIKASDTKKLEKWKNGAGFLWRDEEEWPPQNQELQKNFWIATKELKERRL